MNKLYIFLLIFFSFLVSKSAFSQKNDVNKIRSEEQIVNGTHATPKSKSLEKAEPTSIIVNESNNSVIPDKPEKNTKKEKKSKYGIKKDEE